MGIRKVILILVLIMLLATLTEKALAPVPVTVYGYVYMPDGSPAPGASVTVSAGGVKKSTTTDSNGKYSVTLSVESTPVTVKVTAKKGSYTGSATKSNVAGAVRIDVKLKAQQPPQPKKEKVKVEITIQKEVYALGETVTINGTITPETSGNVEIYVTPPNGTEKSYRIAASDGKFSYSFKVDALGKWEVYALFLGNDKYGTSKSNPVTFYVKIKPQLNFNAIAKESGKVEIKGRINPATSSTQVTVYISIDGGRTWLPFTNITTDQNGNFQVELNLTVSGNLLLKLVTQETEQLLSVEAQQPTMFKLESPTEKLLRQQLDAALQAQANLTKQVQQLKQENQQLKEQIEELHSQLENANQALIQAQNISKTLNAQLKDLQRENQQLRNTLTLALPIAGAAGAAAGSIIEHLRIKRKNPEED